MDLSESPRRHARELVLKGLYAGETSGLEPEYVCETVLLEEHLDPVQREFAKEFFLQAWQHREWADTQIAALSHNWDVSRLANLDRNIMRMALVELEFRPDTPMKVSLNEAIELAKKYSTAESSAFINGILDRFVKNRLAKTDS